MIIYELESSIEIEDPATAQNPQRRENETCPQAPPAVIKSLPSRRRLKAAGRGKERGVSKSGLKRRPTGDRIINPEAFGEAGKKEQQEKRDSRESLCSSVGSQNRDLTGSNVSSAAVDTSICCRSARLSEAARLAGDEKEDETPKVLLALADILDAIEDAIKELTDPLQGGERAYAAPDTDGSTDPAWGSMAKSTGLVDRERPFDSVNPIGERFPTIRSIRALERGSDQEGVWMVTVNAGEASKRKRVRKSPERRSAPTMLQGGRRDKDEPVVVVMEEEARRTKIGDIETDCSLIPSDIWWVKRLRYADMVECLPAPLSVNNDKVKVTGGSRAVR